MLNARGALFSLILFLDLRATCGYHLVISLQSPLRHSKCHILVPDGRDQPQKPWNMEENSGKHQNSLRWAKAVLKTVGQRLFLKQSMTLYIARIIVAPCCVAAACAETHSSTFVKTGFELIA